CSAWTCSAGGPSRALGENDEASQVYGCPHVRAPCSPTPVGSSPLASRDVDVVATGFHPWRLQQAALHQAGPESLSRLHRTASHSLCTLRSQRHRWTTQHSVPAGSLRLAGQVHLLLRHSTRFQLCFMHPPRPSSSGAQNLLILPLCRSTCRHPADCVYTEVGGSRTHRLSASANRRRAAAG